MKDKRQTFFTDNKSDTLGPNEGTIDFLVLLLFCSKHRHVRVIRGYTNTHIYAQTQQASVTTT